MVFFVSTMPDGQHTHTHTQTRARTECVGKKQRRENCNLKTRKQEYAEKC